MKHKEYVTGVVTGVLAATLAAGGLNYVHQNQSGSVLADSAHVEKVEYLEKLIDQEYLGDVDQDKLAEGIYAGLIYGLGDVYSRYYTAEEFILVSGMEEAVLVYMEAIKNLLAI